MIRTLPQSRVALSMLVAAAFLALPQTASAQVAPTSGNLDDPRPEAFGALLGSEFSIYRNAIAARRNLAGTPSVRQDSNSITSDEAPSWGGLSSAWAALDTKQLNGTYSGNSSSLIFGADTLVGGSAIVGLIAGYNNSSVTVPSGQRIKADGFTVGPYFSAPLSESLSLDGFFALGRPDYDVDGGQFNGDKTVGNLTLTGRIPLASGELTPFISVASAREELPAFVDAAAVAYAATTIEGFVTTLGTSMNFNPIESGNSVYLPHASLEIDFVRNNDGFGGVTDFTAPRLSGGVNIFTNAGIVAVGGDVSRSSEGTTVAGANLSYFWQF